MNSANPYYLGEFISGPPYISLYHKTPDETIGIDGDVPLKAINGAPVFYDSAPDGPYLDYFDFPHPTLGKDGEGFEGNLGIIEIGPGEYKHDFHIGFPIDPPIDYDHDYPEVSDIHGFLDYPYIGPHKYYIDHMDYRDQVEHVIPSLTVDPLAPQKKRGRKPKRKRLPRLTPVLVKRPIVKRKAPKIWVKCHGMVTRTSVKKTMDLEEPEPIPEPISVPVPVPVPVPEPPVLKDENPPKMSESIQEIIPKIELQEQDLMPSQGITYYINSYTMTVFGTKKYRRNSKNLTCIVFSVPREASIRRQVAVKYLLNYNQPFIPTIMLLESLKTHETFLNFCKDANLANKPHKIFSKVIQQLGKISNPYNDSDSSSHYKRKKFKRSWRPDSINAINAAQHVVQPKPKPLGSWAGFFCGDYKSHVSTHSDYVEGLYLVDIDDIAIDFEGFEHQFKWEIDLLWERGEISKEERDSWYRLGGLDAECIEYHRLARERYEKNNEFYGRPEDQLDFPDNHVITNFNVVNTPPGFKPLPPLIEPKLKYPRAEEYRGARTSYSRELDQDFPFKLSLHFPHEFITP